jgi:hypothetical protein
MNKKLHFVYTLKREKAQGYNFKICIHILTKQSAALQVKCKLANAPAL